MSEPNSRAGIGGPKTEEGKMRSSLNALKHGLNAQSPHAIAAIEGESPIEYQPYLDKVKTHYRPHDPIEDELVERIALCFWRLARAADMDKRSYGRNPSASRPGASIDSTARYERLIDMQLHRAIKALEKRRAKKQEKTQSAQAPRLDPSQDTRPYIMSSSYRPKHEVW